MKLDVGNYPIRLVPIPITGRIAGEGLWSEITDNMFQSSSDRKSDEEKLTSSSA